MNAILIRPIPPIASSVVFEKAGYQEPEIQKTLGVHPYRVKLALNQCRRYGTPLLEAAFQQLVETEYALKTSVGIKEMQLEWFIPPILRPKNVIISLFETSISY